MGKADGDLDALLTVLAREAGAGKGPAPVDLWSPTRCGAGDFEIRADGVWLHEGAVIGRPEMVRLFASILRRDPDGTTWLVTPSEKVAVRVEDAPFTAIRADRAGAGRAQSIVFTTNVGDITVLGPDRPLRVRIDEATGEPRPYVVVRGRLEARVLRAAFYELVEWGETHGDRFGVWSGGAFFPMDRSGE